MIFQFFLLFTIVQPVLGFVFHGTQETLECIKNIIERKESGCYLRFGDGDLNLAYGMSELCQLSNVQLQAEMRETFLLEGKQIIKTLPLHCKEYNGLEEGMFPGNHEVFFEQAHNFLIRASSLWQNSVNDIYSPVALAYTASHKPQACVEFLRFLKNQNCMVLIGNEQIPQTIINLLFGPHIAFIPVPTQNAYSSIDQADQDAQALLSPYDFEYKVVILSMGCAGRILAKRLWKERKNIFIFDFGSLMDALCGWNTRAWIEATNFDRDYLLNQLGQ